MKATQRAIILSAILIGSIVSSSCAIFAQDGVHDMLLMLPNGPMHLRVRIHDQGKSLKQVREEYLTKLVMTLDTDQDGKLSRDETAKHPLFTGSRKFEKNEFLDSLRSRRPFTDRELSLQVDRTVGQLVSYRQNNVLSDQDLSVFRTLDTDESGMIDRVEMRLAPARIAQRDSDFDQCITFDEFVNESSTLTQGLVVNDITETPENVHSELLRDASEPITAARLVRKYDRDRDAHLTSDELGWNKERLEQLDSDHNSKLSMQELAKFALEKPDIAIEVDLSRSNDSAMKLIGSDNEFVAQSRADLVRYHRANQSLTLGYRFRDPLAEASQNAASAFNVIDADANGYLDRTEIAEHQRFERYLFDAMDKDKDDRVFAAEMQEYVRAYTEPTSTTCQVTLMDTGNGFFQMLDANGDGRISVRELRQCEQQLIKNAGSEPNLNPSKMNKSYRVEIQRGSVSLFGRVDRPSAETPNAILKPSQGPVWFQRMDRNSDGDLTWDEFLGPRDLFHRLDADQDNLIDESEAARAMAPQ